MTLKELVKKLEDKPNQDTEVEFVVYETESSSIVCIDVKGVKAMDFMKILAKRGKQIISK